MISVSMLNRLLTGTYPANNATTFMGIWPAQSYTHKSGKFLSDMVIYNCLLSKLLYSYFFLQIFFFWCLLYRVAKYIVIVMKGKSRLLVLSILYERYAISNWLIHSSPIWLVEIFRDIFLLLDSRLTANDRKRIPTKQQVMSHLIWYEI